MGAISSGTYRRGATGALIRIGFTEMKRPVTVVAGQSITLDMALTKSVISLQRS